MSSNATTMGVDSRARLLAHRCVSSSIMMVYMLALTAAFLLPTTALGAVMSKKKISVAVYSVLPSPDAAEVARKQMHDLENSPDDTTQLDLTLNYLTLDQQRAFLLEHSEQCAVKGVTAVTVFDALNDSTSMQSELYKWCALATLTSQDMVLWLDSHSPILDAAALQRTLRTHDNVAVVLDEKNPHGSSSIHGSYFQMRNTAKNRQLAKQMLEILLQTETALLQTHALLVPHTLHGLIQKHNENWYLLQLKCRQGTATQQQESRSHLACPTGYCCSIQDVNAGRTLMISRHYVVPYQSIVSKHRFLSATQNGAIDDGDDERPFMSTVTVKEIHHPSDGKETPNFYEILEQAKCLPNDYCSRCLREKKGSTCESCAVSCPCYCTKLCHTPVPPKRIVQEWTVSPPLYAQDPSRLIPRIVHQTWFEAVQPEAYPNMSRLVESFRQSGWEYRFYNDNDAAAFLQRHFPPAVFEAYQALIPGAFKADLFRYCVLLIAGGIYADVDIHLESTLDLSIPPNVGFMVPIDEPGKPVHKQMCLWNGLIASAPNHPFLAKAIETVVNQVRNRFTSLDTDNTFCPNPELSVLHAYDTLFTAGPCLLGASLNRVLGRNGQTSHLPGEMYNLWTGPQREMTKQGTSFVFTGDDDSQIEHRIPGRTIILHQNKWDMGAHRFTFLENNLVVAATDLPDSNDRDKKETAAADGESSEKQPLHEHYSKAHAKTGVYGVEHLYVDQKRANEDIRIVVNASSHAKKQQLLATVT